MEVRSLGSGSDEGTLVLFKLRGEVLVKLLEVRHSRSYLGSERWSQVLILLLQVCFLLGLLELSFLHSWWQLRQLKANFGVSLDSFVSLIVLVKNSLIEWHKHFPWNLVCSKWGKLWDFCWKLGSLFGGLSSLLVSLSETERSLSSLDFSHGKLPVILRSLSLHFLHLLELVTLDSLGDLSGFVLDTQSSLFFPGLVSDHFLNFLLADGETLLR